jgi:hypothetical protein
MGLFKGLKQACPQLFVIKVNEILKFNIFIKSNNNNGFKTNENLIKTKNIILFEQSMLLGM